MKTSKITLATVKSFVKKHSDHLYIQTLSSFNGMSDMVEATSDGFSPAKVDSSKDIFNAIKGAHFVGGSRDYFTSFESVVFTGIKVYNSCGSFNLAILKPLSVS